MVPVLHGNWRLGLGLTILIHIVLGHFKVVFCWRFFSVLYIHLLMFRVHCWRPRKYPREYPYWTLLDVQECILTGHLGTMSWGLRVQFWLLGVLQPSV